MGIFTKLFGTHTDRQLKSIYPIVDRIEALGETYKEYTDEQLQAKTPEFKERLANGETLDDLLPEAFAVAREAAWRVTGMRPFRVQLIGGIVLHQGRIAEMKTGEGKTLVAVLPAYLNALSGEGVHIVTVNDYLATRDSEWMGAIHRFLGVSVGLIVHDMTSAQRKEAYACDITYGTNNEMGFDYLRDNMALYKENQVQRGHRFAIVDEVDSILIDEARTPLIISGQGDDSTDLYRRADDFVAGLRKKVYASIDEKQEEDENIDADYVVDEKARTATLTARGIAKAERAFNVENLADIENATLSHHINQALKARGIMKRDTDYLVKDGEVLIIDEFTGRIMLGRRYSEGLHQAIEAKEHVDVKNENKTLATITFQNYFRLYEKLSGMTGTAMTEEEEFSTIYHLDIVEIPTNRPVIRIDHPDVVYKTETGKYRAIIQQILDCHAKGQPVLVGTVSVEKSEYLSSLLRRKGIEHVVLNAKYHEKEAEIVAQAGKLGAVTIATNMAGRGTDIVLGGKDSTPEEADAVKAVGGLFILGTERHESRRIDNQLRGRSGRQGDPGESRFFLSLNDDIMRLFGSERIMGMMEALNVDEDTPIEHKMLSGAIEQAQKTVESRNFQVRKNVLEFDDVINQQRKIIYDERQKVLNGEDIGGQVRKMLGDYAASQCEDPAEIEAATERLEKEYEQREKNFGPGPDGKPLMREIERVVMLRVVDEYWMDHIDAMDELRRGIGLRGYGNVKPIDAYKQEGFDMFEAAMQGIREETVRRLMTVQVRKEQPSERKAVAKNASANVGGDNTAKKKPVKKVAKPGRNDPCPCGKWKEDGSRRLKYKECCGKNE